MSGYYRKDGHKIGMWEWAKLFEDLDYRRIGKDKIGPFEVSTVWLGLDHAMWGEPLIFETMIFDREGGESGETHPWLDLSCWRYSTLEEAKEGHEAAVKLVRSSVPDALNPRRILDVGVVGDTGRDSNEMKGLGQGDQVGGGTD